MAKILRPYKSFLNLASTNNIYCRTSECSCISGSYISRVKLIVHENCFGANAATYERYRTLEIEIESCNFKMQQPIVEILVKEHSRLDICKPQGAIHGVMYCLTVLCTMWTHSPPKMD